jgi:biopolymer transport protein ExbD
MADLTRIYEGRPDKILFIDAARSLPYQDVFWLYGAVKGAGVEVTAIVPKETRREITSRDPR